MPDVSISGRVRSSKGSWTGGGSTVAIEPGRRYRHYFRGPEGWMDEDPETVKRSITLRTSLYGSRSVEVPPGMNEVSVSFEEGARLRLTLTGRQETPAHRDLRVYLTAASPDPGLLGAGGSRPRGDGVVSLGPIQPGEWLLVVTVPFGNNDTLPLVLRRLSLPPGETELTIPVPGVYDLTAVWEGEKQVHFRIRIAGSGDFSFPTSTTDGKVTWEGLPPGDYEVSLWGTREGQSRTVRIPAESRVVFRPLPPPDCLIVYRDGPGRLAEVGFAEGDKIIGVDGEEPADLEKLQKLLAVASKRDSMMLIVLRNGRRIEIPVAGSLITATEKELGGRMRPGRR